MGGTGRNPTDRSKCGVTRSLLTDGCGIPFGGAIDDANRNDYKLMRQSLEEIPVRRPKPTRDCPQHLCLDKGFDTPARDPERQSAGTVVAAISFYEPICAKIGDEAKAMANFTGRTYTPVDAIRVPDRTDLRGIGILPASDLL
ncbi:MAG TPA: hypothetical protein VHG31_04485 [Stellaceae bacterium]|nr:hypothetical protein [Stellaceae bacterium]